MKTRDPSRLRGAALACGFGLALAQAPALADTGFVRLSKTGDDVMTACNPSSSAASTKCRVTGLPGEPGYTLVASRSAPILVNGVTVGTQYEKAWRNQAQPRLYIFGVRLQMNADPWDASGLAFNVNDLLRQVRADKQVSVAYFVGNPAAVKQLKRAGRTAQGAGEFEDGGPERNNGWVDFRIDVNAAPPSGSASPNSPWLLVKARAPKGYGVESFAMRILNSNVDENGDQNSIYAAAYRATCHNEACEPDGGDDD